MKWFWHNQVKLAWSSILTTQDQANQGRTFFLHPKLSWDSLTQASIKFNISRYHEHFNSSLLDIQHLKLLLRSTISRYHDIYHLKLSTLVLSHQVYYTGKDYSTELQSILIYHVLIHFGLLGQHRIHLCERTCFP